MPASPNVKNKHFSIPHYQNSDPFISYLFNSIEDSELVSEIRSRSSQFSQSDQHPWMLSPDLIPIKTITPKLTFIIHHQNRETQKQRNPETEEPRNRETQKQSNPETEKNSPIQSSMDDDDPNKEETKQHFTHNHPLNLATSPGNIVCNGCNLGITTGKEHYTCRICHSFSLHKLCFHMPQSAAHPAHPDAKLTLAVAAAAVRCRACSKAISGFYYGVGSSYYHNICLALPLAVMVSGHPHPLKIHFSPPYDFGCDLCRKPSYKGWLYRCRFCEFDAHIGCAISQRIGGGRISSSGREALDLLRLRLGIERKLGTAEADADLEEEILSPLMLCTPQSEKSTIWGSRVSSVTEIPSYQFSDMCFSIDLHKSYSDGGGGNPVASDGGEMKEAAAVDSGRSEVGSKNWCDSQQLLNSGKPTTKGYGIGGGGKKNGGIDEAVEDAVTKCSCWRRLLMLCCSCREYKKCSSCSSN